VVGLVHDDTAEVVLLKPGEAGGPLQALHRPHRHPVPAPETGLLRFFYGAAQARGLQELVGGLVQELPTVGEDEAPVPLPDHILNDLGEDDGLPAPGGEHQEGPQKIPLPVPLHGPPGLLPLSCRQNAQRQSRQADLLHITVAL
jgi:hypothetical protein